MNIFFLHWDPEEAARMLCDKHVVKMVLETAQILSTISGGPYKPTHENHPCVLWAKEAEDNYIWLCKHGLAIAEEFERRYGKVHKSKEVIQEALIYYRRLSLPKGWTTPTLCMPDEFKQEDVVNAYRAYYRSKKSICSWKFKNKPDWYDGTTK